MFETHVMLSIISEIGNTLTRVDLNVVDRAIECAKDCERYAESYSNGINSSLHNELENVRQQLDDACNSAEIYRKRCDKFTQEYVTPFVNALPELLRFRGLYYYKKDGINFDRSNNSPKIQVIKHVRTEFKIGLREAKDAVEAAFSSEDFNAMRTTSDEALQQLREKLTGDPWATTNSKSTECSEE